MLLDTDSSGGIEERTSSGNVYNPIEAALCIQLVKAYLACGVPPSRIALISPYRAQLKHLSSLLQSFESSGVELLTIDQCQGRDFDAVILDGPLEQEGRGGQPIKRRAEDQRRRLAREAEAHSYWRSEDVVRLAIPPILPADRAVRYGGLVVVKAAAKGGGALLLTRWCCVF